MRVVLPFVTQHDEVLAALPADVEARYVGGSDRDYYDLLCELWAARETFVIVEHDIVVDATAIAELEACPSDWCGFPHVYGDRCEYGLGCVKFSAALLERQSAAMALVGVMSDGTHPKRHWCRLDAWLQYVILPSRGEVKCKHERPQRHLGWFGSSHGCN